MDRFVKARDRPRVLIPALLSFGESEILRPSWGPPELSRIKDHQAVFGSKTEGSKETAQDKAGKS
jgi:hypothetical protein